MKSKKTIINVLSFIFLGAFLFACMPVGPTDVSNEIKQMDQKYEEAYNNGDAAGIAQLHTMDAKVYPPNMEVMEGRDAIEAVNKKELAENGGIKLGLETVSATAYGDIAIADGKYKVFDPQGNEIAHGKYLTVFKKVNGQWLIQYDMYNTSMPLPPAAPDTTMAQ